MKDKKALDSQVIESFIGPPMGVVDLAHVAGWAQLAEPKGGWLRTCRRWNSAEETVLYCLLWTRIFRWRYLQSCKD